MKFLSILLVVLSCSVSFAEIENANEVLKARIASSSMPIIYGIGAGGISLGNTLEQSKKLLTPPSKGPFESGFALYNEELAILWGSKDTSGNQFPVLIALLKGYLGSMDAGKFGKLNLQTRFSEYQEDAQDGAVRLIQELYVELEKVEDSTFNCLESGLCELNYGDANQANFVAVLPGAIFLVQKESFQLAEIRIKR